MADSSKIEWTDATWNVVTGCDKVSPGCDNCYAETFAERWRGIPGHHFETGFDVTLRPERLTLPLRWRKPRKVFVNSMSDLFHKDIPDEYIARVFAVMALTPQHTYQILTKRHGRMRSLLNDPAFEKQVDQALLTMPEASDPKLTRRSWPLPKPGWPLPNVWLGVSVEDQKRADLRIPALIDTPAAVRFLSCEPLLGPVWINEHIWQTCACCDGEGHDEACARCADNRCESGHIRKLDWVIVGGESGHGARPMHPDWARSLRDQCKQNHVPFLFKQHGEWTPNVPQRGGDYKRDVAVLNDGTVYRPGYLPPRSQREGKHMVPMYRVGKKAAGRELDGRTWDEFPAVTK